MNPQKHFILNLQSVVMNRVITAWKANFAVVEAYVALIICNKAKSLNPREKAPSIMARSLSHLLK